MAAGTLIATRRQLVRNFERWQASQAKADAKRTIFVENMVQLRNMLVGGEASTSLNGGGTTGTPAGTHQTQRGNRGGRRTATAGVS